MGYSATKQRVHDRGIAPDSFLNELVAWGKTAPEELFATSAGRDVYSNLVSTLGPWQGPHHRRAVMLEVMRVLAGFESSWIWTDGVDTTNKTSITKETIEAGIFQVSSDSMGWGKDLTDLVKREVGSLDGNDFQRAMKTNHKLAMEYIARLLRRNVEHNGPVKGHVIDKWVRRDAVDEFLNLLYPPGPDANECRTRGGRAR